MYFPMSGGGGAKPEEIGIKYDEQSDYVQLYYQGVWTNWKRGGLAYPVGTVIDFAYKEDIDLFVIPVSGIWQLEVWGGQGGRGYENYNNSGSQATRYFDGGKGGYAVGRKHFDADDVIYV